MIRRSCETGEEGNALLALGGPLPYERGRRVELGLRPDRNPAQESQDDRDEWTSAAFDPAPGIARPLAASPLAIGPDTPARGTGVLALTPYGVVHGVPAGAYRI